jgi:tRNA nucleotidyltransferase (CCA-adding enzyme)
MLYYIKDNQTLFQLVLLIQSVTSEVYLVGGCVRDAIDNAHNFSGSKIKDFDIVINGDLDVVADVLRDNGWKVDEAGKQFLVMIVSKNNQQFEIALFRKDGTYTDGRRPDYVDVGTMLEDARRRDFTINAVYYDLTNYRYIDPNGTGVKDIENRTLRFIGRAKDRIQEDKLRIMRAYRFAISKGYSMDDKTHSICRRYFEDMIKSIPAMRIMAELDKML